MRELREVSKTYGQGVTEVHALVGVSLSVDLGAMVAVMGPGGSGKSTLLATAGSPEEPTGVLVGGVALSGMSRNAKARLRRRIIGRCARPGRGHTVPASDILPSTTESDGIR